MSSARRHVAAAASAAVLTVTVLAHTARSAPADVLDSVGEALSYQSPGGFVRLQGSGLLDVEAYYRDQLPPALIFEDDDEVFIQPRLTLFADAFFGERIYGFVQARADRGFDPGLQDPDARLDEYFLRYALLRDARLDVQAGKFATVVGNFVARHHSWENPMISAPLLYENITTVSDDAAPTSRVAFLTRRDDADRKDIWVPVVWGPSYTSGVSVSGRFARMSYALEVKNAALSSRPPVWDNYERRWEPPTVSARIGYDPSPPWTLGISASHGPYLRPEGRDTLPAGRDVEDFPQTTVATDIAWAARRWRVWSEVFVSRFDVPNVSKLDTFAYYAEAQYEVSARWFVSARWNQQLFEEIADGAGGNADWDRDVWRLDFALATRVGRHWQAKLEYDFTERDGPNEQGQQLVALQLTAKF
jgi:hypothetical protein